MSEQAFLLKGVATIRMEGTAKIVDVDGNIVREVNLADLGEREAVLKSVAKVWPKSMCCVSFDVDDVFGQAKVEVKRDEL